MLLTKYLAFVKLLVRILFLDAKKECDSLLRTTIKKLTDISKIRILLCSLMQIIAYTTLYIKLFNNPGDVYDIIGWLVALTITILWVTIILFKDAITSVENRIGNKTKIVLSLAFLVGIYFCSAVGSASMNEIFPFSSSNTKYALSLVTFLVFGYIMMLVLRIFLWFATIISWIYFVNYFGRQKLKNIIASIFIIALNIYVPMYVVEKLSIPGFGNFLPD